MSSEPKSTADPHFGKPPASKNQEVSDDGSTLGFTIPGLSLDYFDGLGNIVIWKIARLFECARVTAIVSPDFLFQRLVSAKDRSAFIILIHMQLEEELYTQAKVHSWLWPLHLSTSVAAFGKSSIDFVSFIRDTERTSVLGKLRFKYATVDMKTRKAVPIPDDVKEPYRKYQKPDMMVKGFKPEKRSRHAHRMVVTVRGSDIDRNGHLNNSIYLKMCSDCAAQACHQNFFRFFRGDFRRYLAKDIKGLYQRECRFGELLDVFCWDDDVETNVLHYEVVKSDGKVSFCCKVEYFMPLQPKL